MPRRENSTATLQHEIHMKRAGIEPREGGLDGSVGVATRYGLDGPGIESRWRRDFPLPSTGPGIHPASCTIGSGSFPGVKRPGRGPNHPPHLVPRLKKK